MTTTPDALSDALVAALTAAVPAGALVVDHEALPFRTEDIPPAGVFGVFLFQDQPSDEGTSDSAWLQQRIATFKVELRVPATPGVSPHLLHGTQAARKIVNQILKTNPTLGGLAFNTRMGPMAVLVHETNSAIACCAIDFHADYMFDPDL